MYNNEWSRRIQTIVLLSSEQCTLRNNNTPFMHEFQTTSFIQIMHVRHTTLTNIYFLCSGLSCYEDKLVYKRNVNFIVFPLVCGPCIFYCSRHCLRYYVHLRNCLRHHSKGLPNWQSGNVMDFFYYYHSHVCHR